MFDKIIMYLIDYIKVNYTAKKALQIAWISLLVGFILIMASNLDWLGKLAVSCAGFALAIMLGFEYVYAIQAAEDDDEG